MIITVHIGFIRNTNKWIENQYETLFHTLLECLKQDR